VTTTDDLYDDEDEQEQRQENHNLRLLRDKAEKQLPQAISAKEQAETERDAALRELAFVKAGIDTSTGPAKWFAKAYDGEATPEAIRAAAIADGLIDAGDDPEFEENEARSQVRQARAGSVPSNSHEITPADVAARRKDPGFSEWWRSLSPEQQRTLKDGQPVNR
jgi:hypothetical protein